MKMNYHPRNKSNNKFLKETLIVLGVFVVGVFLFSLVRPVLVPIVAPVWKAESGVAQALSALSLNFQSKSSLLEENQRLRELLASVELERKMYADFSKREEELLALLERVGESGGVVSTVLAHPPQTPYDSLVIDVGQRDGIEVGMTVALPDGPILGEVIEVFNRQSKAALFSTSGKTTNAVLGRGDIPVVLEGISGGGFKMTMPRDSEVEVGDLVYSADIAKVLVAEVESIDMGPTDSFKEVLLLSPVNIFNIRYVVILP